MKVLLRLGAWLLVAAVAFATLGPPRDRPHLPIGRDGEHALAFILVGLAVGFAYPNRRILTAVVVVVLTGGLELMQLFAPGRHARLGDFVVDAVTACAGLAIAAAIGWLLTRVHGSTSPRAPL